jgi:hypothetical protein
MAGSTIGKEDTGLHCSICPVAHHLPTDTCQIDHDHDLGDVMAAWPGLPEAIKAGILAMVKATSGSGYTGHLTSPGPRRH